MADERSEESKKEPAVPPRIKLNGNGTPPAPQTPPPPTPEGAAPPRLTVQPKAGGKSDTSRIELSQARPPTPEETKKATARIAGGTQPIRIMSEVERMAAAKAAEKAKSATGPVPQPPPSVIEEASKRQTTRIDLSEILGGDEDIFKRRTTLLDASQIQAAAAAPQPRTIRIKRPEEAPTGPITPPEPPRVEPIAAEARKAETARLEVPTPPPEEAPTRKKTIRIKRPEGPEPSIARPVSAPSVIARAPAMAPAEEEESTLFSILSLVALLVTCFLIYVLIAQVGTLEMLDPPNLPMFGGV